MPIEENSISDQEEKDNTSKNMLLDNDGYWKSINAILMDFITHISSLHETLPLVISSISEDVRVCSNKSEELFEKYVITNENDAPGKLLVRADRYPEFLSIMKQIRKRILALKTVPSSYLVSMISNYDAFLSHLVRKIMIMKPDLLNSSERRLTFNQLAKFPSIEVARDWIIEKEVESVIRQSHISHFDWMEKKFGLPLRKDLEVWSDFIEITERRNLFVHTGGVVSSQYLDVCQRNGVVINEDVYVGTQLTVSPDYVAHAYNVIFEIGFKLAHVLWRKFQSDDIEDADKNLIDIGYEKLFEEDYYLTGMIFDFALNVFTKYSSEHNKRLMIINRVLGYKWNGNNERAIEILKAEDWTACCPKFRLAEAVILERYEKAVLIMNEIGDNGSEVAKEEYRHWPLFKEFRQSPEFLSAYEKIFDENFNDVIVDEEDIFPSGESETSFCVEEEIDKGCDSVDVSSEG